MEKTIINLFYDKVVEVLMSNLAAARVKEPETNSIAVGFDVADVLRELGATGTTVTVRVAKDYAWLDVEAKQDGFYHRLPTFSQRNQAKKEELAAMTELADAKTEFADAYCVAGLYLNGDDIRTSFRWDKLITDDGEVIKYTGKVRKYHAETDSYDGPVEE